MAPDDRHKPDEADAPLNVRAWLPFGRSKLGEKQLKSLRYLAGMALLGVTLLLFNPGGEPRDGWGVQSEPASIGVRPASDAVPAEDALGAAGTGGPSERSVEAAAQLERELTGILAQMRGVGSVDVEVVLKGSGTRTYALERTTDRSETREQDEAIDRQVVDESSTETPVLVRGQDGAERALVVSEARPKVAGVLVVAEGAGDPVTRWALIDAVSTVLDVPAHRVSVHSK